MANFQVVKYQYSIWSSRISSKTDLILMGAAGETCTVHFVESLSGNIRLDCRVFGA